MPLTAEEFQNRVEALQWVEFPEGTADAERTIPAAWIAALFPEPSRVATHPIRVRRAIIDGDLILRYASAPYELEITRSEFTGTVNFFGSTFERICSFAYCHFRKEVFLGGTKAKHDLRIRGCVFDDSVDLSDATVDMVFNASGAHFHGTANLERVSAKSVMLRPIPIQGVVQPTRFEENARFHDLKTEYFDASGAQFAKEAQFHRTRVTGVTFFAVATFDDDLKPIEPMVTRFIGESVFRHARFGAELSLAGAHFSAPAAFHASHVDGRFILEASVVDPFRFPTRFDATAGFSNMEIGENLLVGGCQFGADCWMDAMQVHGAASFSWVHDNRLVAAVFEGPFTFGDTVVNGYTGFQGVTFRDTANFSDTQIHNTASFIQTYPPEVRPTIFEKKANFYRMRVDGDFWCEGAEFRGDVSFWYLKAAGVLGLVDDHDGQTVRAMVHGPARFDGVQARDLLCSGVTFAPQSVFRGIEIAGLADFESARFNGNADFRGAKIGRRFSLESAKVAGKLVLRDAAVTTFTAPDFDAASPNQVDARGFTFQRVDGRVRELLRRQEPYDLEIYERVESAMRTSGNDDVAGAMYVDRRRRETRAHWQQVFAPRTNFTRRLMQLLLALYGNVQGLLFRYGVRPLRLIALSVLVLGFGTWVFSHRGAVRLKDKPDDVRKLSRVEALGYSARVFMPVGDLPSGAGLVPTEKTLPRVTLTYEAWATIQRLLGLLLVPLGIASITGVLVRKR